MVYTDAVTDKSGHRPVPMLPTNVYSQFPLSLVSNLHPVRSWPYQPAVAERKISAVSATAETEIVDNTLFRINLPVMVDAKGQKNCFN